MKMDFVPHIARLFPAMLMAITGDKDADVGHRAALSLVQRFGDLCPELLLPAFETVYVANLDATTPESRQRQTILREKNIALLAKVADKILEHKKFGQDLLTTDGCGTKETREYLLCLVMLARSDSSADVKRQANGCWKNVGGAPKVQKAIMPVFEKMLLRMREGKSGLGAQKLAIAIIAQLVKDKELEPIQGDEPEKAQTLGYQTTGDRASDSAAASIVVGESPVQDAMASAFRGNSVVATTLQRI